MIIGNSVRTGIFGHINPIGKIILIQNIPFKVIGSLAEIGESFSGRDFDNLLVMPYTTAGIKIVGKKTLDQIYVAVHAENMIKETETGIRNYFRRVHSLSASSYDTFRIETSKEKLKLADYISTTLSYLLAGIASISLFVGGVGIMNIMLVSVSERTREIGIRMAIGAKRKDILMQFLVESVTLSSAGGAIGIAIGLIVYYFIVYFVSWPFLFSMISVIISFLFSSCVGIFFGYYPARKASKLAPIDALRYE